ncbi:MAG: helix-turn-helix domain-containing protein [Actinomycetota bacterium]
MGETGRLGAKVRALRRREGLTQVALAERLGISASYLNLIEHNRRPLPAPLLIKVVQLFQIDVQALAPDDEPQLAEDLMEAFGDELFDGHELAAADVHELAAGVPPVGRAVLALYRAYRETRQKAEGLAAKLFEGQELTTNGSTLPSEEVSDLLQRHLNHFPELEHAAERLWRSARLDPESLYPKMTDHLERARGVEVRVERVGALAGATRRYDPQRKVLLLSEALGRASRNFQVAHMIGLLEHPDLLDRLAADGQLTSEESHALARVALANYFAAAVLMPYEPFLTTARSERYDIELMATRFDCTFEQVCHRLTTLSRPGAEGIPFHLVRIDVAGNISKRFSASGMHYMRFSAGCPRWNVYGAFLTPGVIRVQLSQMPDRTLYFSIARTVRRDWRFRATPAVLAIELGCEARHAGEMVYSEGIDLADPSAAVPIGVTCRLCPRIDCQERAFPPMQHPLHVDENTRGPSFYAPVLTD